MIKGDVRVPGTVPSEFRNKFVYPTHHMLIIGGYIFIMYFYSSSGEI
jgi:hypothetical protein